MGLKTQSIKRRTNNCPTRGKEIFSKISDPPYFFLSPWKDRVGSIRSLFPLILSVVFKSASLGTDRQHQRSPKWGSV